MFLPPCPDLKRVCRLAPPLQSLYMDLTRHHESLLPHVLEFRSERSVASDVVVKYYEYQNRVVTRRRVSVYEIANALWFQQFEQLYYRLELGHLEVYIRVLWIRQRGNQLVYL